MIAKCLNCNRDYEQETQGAICPHDIGGPNSSPPWPKVRQTTTLDEHKRYVAEFLREMYATMIDPIEEPRLTVADLCDLLLNAARDQREQLNRLNSGNPNYTPYAGGLDVGGPFMAEQLITVGPLKFKPLVRLQVQFKIPAPYAAWCHACSEGFMTIDDLMEHNNKKLRQHQRAKCAS